MTSIAIRTEALGKRYRIGAAVARARTLREAITNAASAPLRQLRKLRWVSSEDHGLDLMWALRDLSFDVHEGEVVGIIGRNGAGKSTLLKLLCRITQPTTGSADMYGRVGSLLEVGTGFHIELTGRDNIYLSGSILGMDRGYIDQRFEEIVEFSGVGAFLDTPVKRYSSGMYLRLAFAVAAHLEPDVLIVDEVLAVGDAEFQKKCLGRMGVVAREGRTVLFVSHNLEAIQRLCPRSLLLENGTLVVDGPTHEVSQRYYLLSSGGRFAPAQWIDLSSGVRRGATAVRLQAAKYTSHDPSVSFYPYPEGPLEFVLAVDSDAPRYVGGMAVIITSQSGTRLVNADSLLFDKGIALRQGRNFIALKIKSLHLTPGTYRVSFWLNPLRAKFSGKPFDYLEDAIEIEVVNNDPTSSGIKPNAYVTCEMELQDLSTEYAAILPEGFPEIAAP
jgi:ABC-type polysaccharide/polyol phosphate transport system ATPase subunit